MASTQCWDCGEVARMLPVPGTGGATDDGRYSTFTCQECGSPSLCFFEPDQECWGQMAARWVPLPGLNSKESFSDVPARVAEAAAEAVLCMHAGARRGAILLARAVIEATAKDKGVTGGNLQQKIERLHAAGLLPEVLRDGAHEVRYTGNDMAHGDFPASITKADADVLLNLM